jgi:hypothetical protein
MVHFRKSHATIDHPHSCGCKGRQGRYGKKKVDPVRVPADVHLLSDLGDGLKRNFRKAEEDCKLLVLFRCPFITDDEQLLERDNVQEERQYSKNGANEGKLTSSVVDAKFEGPPSRDNPQQRPWHCNEEGHAYTPVPAAPFEVTHGQQERRGVQCGVSNGVEDSCRLPALWPVTPETAIRPYQGWLPVGRRRVGCGRL